MSGQKIGSKLSDSDSIWVEKWFEVKIQDGHLGEAGHVPKDLIIKSWSKFWTNVENNQIEGESCLQVLQEGTHTSLRYELRESYTIENILNKTGSLKSSVQDSKPVNPNFSF